MNNKRAKEIKKFVYGDDYSPKFRTYKRYRKTWQIVADDKRQQYQTLKKLYTRRQHAKM